MLIANAFQAAGLAVPDPPTTTVPTTSGPNEPTTCPRPATPRPPAASTPCTGIPTNEPTTAHGENTNEATVDSENTANEPTTAAHVPSLLHPRTPSYPLVSPTDPTHLPLKAAPTPAHLRFDPSRAWFRPLPSGAEYMVGDRLPSPPHPERP